MTTPTQPADEFACSRALDALAGLLDAEGVARALRLAHGMRDAGARARTLAVLARAVPSHDRPVIFEEALAAARSIGDPWRRVRALTPIGMRLRGEGRAAIAGEILEAALRVEGDWLRGRALSLLANIADGEIRRKGLAAALALGAPSERASALCAYAGDLHAQEVERLMAQAEKTGDEWLRQTLLTSLAGRLTPAEIEGALGMARRQPGALRALTLAELARAIPMRGPELLEEALASARTLDRPFDRAETLTALGSSAAAGAREAALAEAHAAARRVSDASMRAMLLVGLLGLLQEPAKGEALAEAVAAARNIGDPILQAESLSGLVTHIAEGERGAVIEEVFRVFEDRA